ncbi:unnamed protein product, partial [marine sediment metagenome]
ENFPMDSAASKRLQEWAKEGRTVYNDYIKSYTTSYDPATAMVAGGVGEPPPWITDAKHRTRFMLAYTGAMDAAINKYKTDPSQIVDPAHILASVQAEYMAELYPDEANTFSPGAEAPPAGAIPTEAEGAGSGGAATDPAKPGAIPDPAATATLAGAPEPGQGASPEEILAWVRANPKDKLPFSDVDLSGIDAAVVQGAKNTVSRLQDTGVFSQAASDAADELGLTGGEKQEFMGAFVRNKQ